MLIETFQEDSEEANSNIIFMQNGVPALTSRMAMEWLEDRFPGKLLLNKLISFGRYVLQTLTP